MSARDLSPEDFEGLLHSHSQRLAMTQFAELEEHPCTPKEGFWMTAGAFLLGCAPVLIVLGFKFL